MKWQVPLLALALLEPVIRLDHTVSRAVQGLRRPALEGPMRQLTSAGKPATVVSAVLAVALVDEISGIVTLRGCVAILIPVNLAVEGLKWAANRTRPDGERRRSNSSFPSSHAANALALSWILSRRWPRATIPFHALAALVMLSRLYLNRHFLSDVVVGAAIGAGMAVLVTRIWPALDPRKVGSAGK